MRIPAAASAGSSGAPSIEVWNGIGWSFWLPFGAAVGGLLTRYDVVSLLPVDPDASRQVHSSISRA